MFSSGNPQDMDMLTSVNMDILRGEMKLRLDPPARKPEGGKEGDEDDDDVPLSRVARLEKNLEVQLEEEEKWNELTSKLEKKSKQMADLVVRLDTSVKVFQHELVKRKRCVVDAEEQLEDKIQDQQRVIEKIRQDKDNQLVQAAKSKERYENAKEELEERQEQYEILTNRLRSIRSGLVPLEERVQNLQINLIGNRGMSDSQQIYYNADLQVERDHRDRVLKQIQGCQQEMETLSRELTTLKGRQSLFRDENLRRLQKAKTLDVEIQEQEDSFKAKLNKYRAEVDTIRKDRDEWEEKTTKLVKDLEEKRIETSKLTVKARLFKAQHEGVQATVERLKSMIEDSRNMSVTSINEDDSDDDSEDDLVAVAAPEPVKNNEDKPYVWVPPKREDAITTPSSWMTATKSKPSPIPVSVPAPGVINKKTPQYVPPSVVVKPVYPPSPPMVKVNHVKVQMDNVNVEPSSVGKPYQAMQVSNNRESLLTSQLQDVQRDLDHQKRFQKEHALKMEAQFARLASKVEVLADHGSDSAANRVQQTSTESQLNALKTQMQKDAMRDNNEMRQLLQQLTQQCSQLSNKLEGITQTVQRRDQENDRMEKKLKEKETQYYEQMEAMRGEMDRQLERQQQLFSEKMSQAMIQMEKLVTSGAAAQSNTNDHDSMSSLESLAPMDSSSRRTSRSSLLDKDDIASTPAPTTAHVRSNSWGYSMVASEVLKNGPWF